MKYPESAQRALALRIYCNFGGHGNQKKFAEWLGMSQALWGMIERGNAQFSYSVIKLIKKRHPAIDMEWLRDGYEGKMPPDIMRPLAQILNELRKGNTSAA